MSDSHIIHPTAIVDPGARLGHNVSIGPYSVVGEGVELGDNVILKSHVVVEGRTSIGNDTVIFPFASIGHAPQDLKYGGEPTKLVIGSSNTIREYVTINPGTVEGGGETVIGDHNLFMIGTHVAHDCRLGSHIVMANNATLAGHVRIGDHVWFGGLSAVHQYVRIGDFAIIGGMSGVESDVIPFGRVKGERAFLAGLNIIRMERMGLTKDQIKSLQKAFQGLFSDDLTLDKRIEAIAVDFKDDPNVMRIIEFAREKSKFSLCQPKSH